MDNQTTARRAPARRPGAQRIGNVYFASFGAYEHRVDPEFEQLSGVIAQIREAVDSINSASREIAAGNVELTRYASDSSKKVMDVIGIIDSVAFESNILALNAAIEANRAGDHGRGVSMVAVEIRNLVQKSALATREIHALIRETVRKLEGSSKLVDEVGRTMDEIVRSVRDVTDLMSEISGAEPAASAPLAWVGPPRETARQGAEPVTAVPEEA